jgi:hypothetical protein
MAVCLEVSEIGDGQADFVPEIVGQISIGKDADGVLDDGTDCPFNNSILVIDIGYRELQLCSYLFLLALYILDDEFLSIIGPEAKNREIIDDIFILKLNYRVLLLPGLPNIFFLETYIPRHSGVVVDDNEDISEACS